MDNYEEIYDQAGFFQDIWEALPPDWKEETPKEKSYTSLGMIIWDISVEYDVRNIFSQTKCPKCLSENIEKTDRKFHCLDCDFCHADYRHELPNKSNHDETPTIK